MYDVDLGGAIDTSKEHDLDKHRLDHIRDYRGGNRGGGMANHRLVVWTSRMANYDQYGTYGMNLHHIFVAIELLMIFCELQCAG